MSACAFSIADAGGPGPPSKGAPEALRSNGWGCRVIGTASEDETFAITVNQDTMGVVPVDLERSAPERQKKARRRQQVGATSWAIK